MLTELPPTGHAVDVEAIDPTDLNWDDLPHHGAKMRFLRQYPGAWFLVGRKSYKGGFTRYTRDGFLHAVRSSPEGGWDHYLSCPAEA